MKKVILNKIKPIGFILLFLLLYSFIYTLFINYFKNYYAEVITSFIMIIFCFILFHDVLIKNFKEIKSNKKIKNYLIMFIVVYLITFLINLIIYKFTGIHSTNEDSVRLAIKSYPLIYLIQVILLSPIYEEIIFRLNFKKVFNNKYIFSLITAFIFAFFHLIGVKISLEYFYLITYFILGYTLSYIYFDSDNIYISIFIHSLNNIITILLLFGGLLP